jgi:endonuclease G
MKKFTLIFLSLFLVNTLYSQKIKNIVTNTFIVKYSEELEQPLYVFYNVLCPRGKESRSGLDFKKYDGVHTSNNEDYVDNIWDKGHLAPAASFNCDREILKSTFSYLNCALQHQSLNRGPWRELEEFEKNLSKIYDKVNVSVECHFSENSMVLPTGATVPDGFTKTIIWDDREECFYFPNKDVKGVNWFEFRIN